MIFCLLKGIHPHLSISIFKGMMDQEEDICVHDINGNRFSNSLDIDLDFILVSPAFSKIISMIFSIINYLKKIA